MGIVYLVWAKGTNRYKIGFTNRKFEERMRELSSGQSPYPLELVKKVVCDKAPEVESKLHQRFSICRSYGEWFEFDAKEVIEVRKLMDVLTSKKKAIPNLLILILVSSGLLILIATAFQPQVVNQEQTTQRRR